MSQDEENILRAAYEIGNGQPRIIEYRTLAVRTNLAETVVRSIAGQLQQQRLCMATFGGLQLTSAGMNLAIQN
jgi:hypothetical protein